MNPSLLKWCVHPLGNPFSLNSQVDIIAVDDVWMVLPGAYLNILFAHAHIWVLATVCQLAPRCRISNKAVAGDVYQQRQTEANFTTTCLA